MMKTVNQHLRLLSVLVGLLMVASIGTSSVRAEPVGGNPLQPTPFPTPTPGPDGKIIYTVKEGDTLWRIAAIAGISVEELMTRNGIQPDDFITEGMELELGLAGPVGPTAAPDAELTEVSESITPTPVSGTGEICVLLYLDANGNARLDAEEGALQGGQVSVADVSGSLAGEHTTTLDPEGHCFTDLEYGDYNVSAAVPEDYNPTTVMNVPVRLNPGDIKYVQFGAQPSSAGQNSGLGTGGGRSTVLGLLGLLLLLAGGGLGYYVFRSGRGVPRSLR